MALPSFPELGPSAVMPYSFQPFLETSDANWYEDDGLLQRLLARYRGPAAEEDLGAWGEEVAGPLRRLAEESARPENRPWLRRFDAYSRRVDEVMLPGSTLEALREVEGRHRLGAVHGNPFEFYAKWYLYYQNGEAGVACSMACTDGLVRALEALGDQPEHRAAVENVRGSTAERVYHGAQFVTEIQGGSDVPANVLEARPDGEWFRLFGQKWFCSNINADYFLVTGRPDGAPAGRRGVGLFLVPAYLEEGGWQRNGYTVDRLKEKLGTRELATAEVTFDGALAHPVGPLERGLPNLVSYVLVPSRVACVIFAAAALRRAERIVAAYTEFRTAFGRQLLEYPLVREAVTAIRSAREQALAILFDLLVAWGGTGGDDTRAHDFRVLLSLAKPVLTRRATELLHEAVLLLGGNGIEEEFSPLPRLYRDAAVMETWEGPHNVLLSQALGDLVRFEVDPAAFVARVAGEERGDLADELGRLLGAADDPEATVPFARLAERLVRAYGERLVGELA